MLMKIADIVGYINLGITGLLILFFLPRIIMMIYSCFDKPIAYPKAKKNHKYAVVICARNEEGVIANLIESIKNQDYPVPADIFVAADNCTDKTAKVAREAGAIVYERFNTEKKGKAFALDFIFQNIFANHDDAGYEAFIFFDADNVASKNYITKVNDAFDSGLEIFTTFRNTKNFGDNWLSKSAALMMMYDSRFAQHAKVKMGMSACVAGTGFLASARVIKEQGGWIHNTAMTEDLEFSVAKIFEGKKIGYCYAEYFEEQPVTMRDSANQRARWIRGAYQVYGMSGSKFWKALFSKKYDRKQKGTFYDLIIFTFPTPMLATIWFCSYYGIMITLGILNVFGIIGAPGTYVLYKTLLSLGVLLGGLFLGCFILGICVSVKLRKHIKATKWQKFTAPFSFILFLFSWLPVSFMGANKKLKWKVIPHTDSKKIAELDTPAENELYSNETGKDGSAEIDDNDETRELPPPDAAGQDNFDSKGR